MKITTQKGSFKSKKIISALKDAKKSENTDGQINVACKPNSVEYWFEPKDLPVKNEHIELVAKPEEVMKVQRWLLSDGKKHGFKLVTT